MKKILIFSLAYYPHVGGAEVSLREITDRVDPKEIEFHTVTMRFSSRDAREEKIGNVIVHRVGNGSSYFSKILFVPRAVLRARRLHATYHFDAFWAMMTYMLFPVVIARACGTRVPYLLTLQDGDPFEHVFLRWYIMPFRALLSFGFRHATVVQTISTFLAGWARRAGAVGNIEVIPNGTDTQSFAEAKAVSVGRKDDEVILVSTSRLVYKNGLDDVISALKFLPKNVRFINYGFGQDKEKLQTLAIKSGVSGRVELLPHPGVPELPPYLKAADIFIRPSRSEGFGISFIEAMAAGLPVIATQEGGLSDFLFDEKRNPGKETTGWAVDKESPKQIAEAVNEIISHPDKVLRVIETAKKVAQEKYDWNIIAKDIKERAFWPLFQITKFGSRGSKW